MAGNGATFSSKSGNNYTYIYTVQGTEGEGNKAVNVSATDLAGNTGSSNTTVTFDFTSPTISNLVVNPTTAKSGTNLTITFTVSETLQSNPTVTVAGNGATFNSKSGNNYTYIYTVQGTEGEGSKTVNVSATDLAGNTGSANTTVTFDFASPTISNLAVNPGVAKSGTNLTITFTVSEALPGNPSVTVAGNGATFSSKSGNNYTYTYTVQGTEGEGSKAVNVSATDSAGNTGSGSTTVAFDFTGPTISNLTVNPPTAKAGTNLTITFTVSEALPCNPTVTVAGNGATFSSKSGNNYTYTYMVQGTEGEGNKAVNVSATDSAGNPGSGSTTATFDFTVPTVSNLTVNPTIAKAGTNLTITFTVSETLQSNPTVTVAGNGATFSIKSGNDYTYTYIVKGTEGEGNKPVNVSATDLAGNTSSASTTITFDFTGPTISNLAVNPTIAKAATNLSITFTVSEALPVNPLVTVAGNGATFSSKSVNNYIYTYAVQGTEGEGNKPVNVSATDLAGNTGSASTPVTFDFTAPIISNLTVNPTTAKSGANLTITFTVSEALQGNPSVTVAGNGATFSIKSGNTYTYTYAVKGTEGEGSKPVNVSATDLAGNTGSGSTTATFDFTAPTVSNLTVNPTIAKSGTNLTITFTMSETLQSNPLVTVAGNGATFETKSGNYYAYSYTVQGTEGEGTKAVNVSATDSAGNPGSASTPVTFDFTAPIISNLTVNPTTAKSGANLTITFTVSEALQGNPSVTVAGNGATFSIKSGNTYTYTYAVKGTEGEGNRAVNVSATDLAGNTGSANTPATFDFTAPSCSANNSGVWHGEDITITLTARDGTSGIAIARYNWDTPASESVGTQYSDGDTIILATDTGTDGKELYLYARDNVGNTQTWNGTYYLDKTGPICSADYSGAWHTDDITITLSFSAGATGNIIMAKYNWDTPASETTGIKYSDGKTITLNTETNGKTLYLYVKDSLGREKTWSGKYYLDKTDPGCSADKSGTWYKEDITITLTARDGISGIAVARYRWDTPASETAGIVYNDGNTITLNTESNSTLYLYVRDNAGRVKTWNGVYYLDKTSPKGEISINNGAVYTSTTSVTLTLSAEDSGSGVSKMRFSNDNMRWTLEEDTATSKSWTLSEPDKDGTKTVYVQYKDRAGNWSGIISDTIILDTVRPTVELLVDKARILPDGEIVGVIPDTGMEAEFSKVMGTDTVKGIKLMAVKNNLNEEICEEVSLGFEWEGSTKTVITTKSELKKNYVYRLGITDGVKDLSGNTVTGERELIFRTIMDYTKKNIVAKMTNEIPKEPTVTVSLEENALKEDGYLIINTEPLAYQMEVNPGAINAANEKSVTDGWYPVEGCLWEIKACNKSRDWLKDNFGSEVKIIFPYDEGGSLKEETLMAFWLNEEHSNWVRVPGSGVDKESNVVVTGEVPNFSVFALMGTALYDLSEAHAYPVPWKPNDGKDETGTEEGGITFTNLAAECVIKIYTISGELVMKHDYKGGGNWTWDVKTSNKEKVFSGVYIYYIEGEKEHKTGRLVIIR